MLFNYDKKGLIVTKDGNGGDTAASEGRYYAAQYLLGNKDFKNTLIFFSILNNLTYSERGIFIRNPIQYNDPKDFSRDQTVPLIIAMGVFGFGGIVKALFKKQLKNYFRYQNNDLGTFEDLNYYIRALKFWYLYPLLLIGDLFSVVGSLIHCFWVTRPANKLFYYLYNRYYWWWLISNAPPNDLNVLQEIRGPECTSNDLNRTLTLLQAKFSYPTPLSWLSRWIYKTFRPNGIQFAWDSYYKNDNPFNELYRPIIKDNF